MRAESEEETSRGRELLYAVVVRVSDVEGCRLGRRPPPTARSVRPLPYPWVPQSRDEAAVIVENSDAVHVIVGDVDLSIGYFRRRMWER